MNKYIFPIIKWKIKPWLKYYILNKPATSYPLSEITTGTSPLTLTNSIRKKFHLFNVGGNTKQQSYTGTNLLPFYEGQQTRNGRTYSFENGDITITGTSTDENTYNVIDGSWTRYSSGVILSKTNSVYLAAGTYTITANKQSTSGTLSTILVYGNLGDTGTALTRTTLENSLTFTLESSKYVTLVIYDYNSNGTNASITGCRINTGSAATDYEPYVGGQASPNPSYPQPVENVSGEVEVKVENKNLAYISSKIDWRYSSTLENGDLKINGTSSDAGNILIKINGGNGLILKPNKTYILSVIMEGTVSGGQYKNIYLKGSSIGTLASNTTRTHKITPTEDYKLEDINLDLAPNITFTNFTIKIQVEEGSTATSYEPHEEQTVTLHLPEGMEMCKIGTYVDIFTKSGSNWIVPNKILKIASYNGETITTPYISSTGGLDIGATVYYVGSEDYVITDPTLISDLESLKNLYSYKGITHISSSNEPSPVFEVQYYMEEGEV